MSISDRVAREEKPRTVQMIPTWLAWGAVVLLSVAGPAYAQGGGGDEPPPEIAGGEDRDGVLRMLLGRLSVHVNGSYQAASRRYERSNGFSTYGEEAMFVTREEFAGGAHIDVGGTVRLWRELSVGADYTEVSNAGTAVVSGTVPHPFDLGRDRTAPAQTVALPHRERATHVQVGWRFALRDGLDLTFSAGPTYFNLHQGVVTNLTVREVGGPGFRDIDLQVGTAERTANGIGFNVRVDTTFMLTRWFGVGYFARLATGSIGVEPSPWSPDVYYVGGFQTGVGLRIRF